MGRVKIGRSTGKAAPAGAVAGAMAGALAAVLLVAASLVLGARLPGDRRMVWWHPEVFVALSWTPVGALLTAHRAGRRVGLLMLGAGISAAVYVLSLNLAEYATLHHWSGAWLPVWLSHWLWAVDTYALTLVLPLVFPDGRLVPVRFRPVLVLACLVPVVVAVHLTIDPGARRFHGGVSVYPLQSIPPVVAGLILTTLALSLVSLAVRFRRAAADVRRQIAWVVYPGLIAEAVVFVGESARIGDVVRDAAIVAVPICVAIAITRYRLYDIDVVINRTLVYAGLVGVITGVYFTLVGAVSLVASDHGGMAGLAGAVGAGVVFEPTRRRLQRGVDRVLHRERDPYRLADRLQRRLQTASDPSAALATAASTVREALHASGVAVHVLDREGNLVALVEDGTPAERAQRVPLVWHGEPVGRMIFSGVRAPDARLAGILARNLAELANAARLALDVQRSRERILRTREEERRRLRRDLHDGLGPTLASLAMTVDAARITMRSDPEAADAMLERLRSTMGHTIGELRDLVYGLRPPALDDLGLAGAIRALGGVVGSGGHGPRVDVQVEGDLAALPAAAEVAAYRIVQEALTNVYRHARAGTAVVRLELNGDLEVSVQDDGVGPPRDLRGGVGMSSMRERAAELGGVCTVSGRPEGGTLVRARLPLCGAPPEPTPETATAAAPPGDSPSEPGSAGSPPGPASRASASGGSTSGESTSGGSPPEPAPGGTAPPPARGGSPPDGASGGSPPEGMSGGAPPGVDGPVGEGTEQRGSPDGRRRADTPVEQG
ncbi:histidine kinase [Actinomadura logoneensis]|uniref:histidine kinase n=1 Tax=Actinomadura logoneensis TaxID=2293572 RepID=UPI0022A6771F|nr:histidine kinase [Actinomadura logoneensis]